MARLYPVRHSSGAEAEDAENHGAVVSEDLAAQQRLTQAKYLRNEGMAALAPQKKRSALEDLTNSSIESTARRRPAAKVQEDFRCEPSKTAHRSAREHADGSRRHQGLSRIARPQQLESRVPQGVHDIDSLCLVLGCPDYITSIMEHLHEAEIKRRPDADYMAKVQTDITADMRCTLVDWLVEVALEFRVVSDTLFLAISFLDRYLSQVPTVRSNLQLVGITCLLIASKYEEIYAPQVDEFVRVTDDSYTRDEVLLMEEHILELLDFELTQPTAKTFVRRFVQAATAGRVPDQRLEHLCAYFVELALCEYGALAFLPSQTAASAVLLAQYCLGLPLWSPTLQYYSGYQPSELQKPVRLLHYVAIAAAAQQPSPISTEKFSTERYKSVSDIRLPNPPLPAGLFNNDFA